MAQLCVKSISSLLSTAHQTVNRNLQHFRNVYQNKHMIKDVKRRKKQREYAPMRLRVNALQRNDVLPVELRQMAAAEIAAFPRDSTLLCVKKMCVITGRLRGVVPRWRLSRIMFRHLADYNKLAGIQRATW